MPTTPQSPLFAVEHLTVRTPCGDELLRDVSLETTVGVAVALLGPSGSGKTTLLRALFDREALEEQGFRVETARVVRNASVGLVPQHGAVFDHLDVAGNIALALEHADGAHDVSRDAIAHWLREVDLDPAWAETPRAPTQLSGGQAQRLAVARVLASGRRVLFLDEPSAGLDPLRVQGLAAQLRRLCDEDGAGVVLVTHDPQLAAAVADRALVVQDHRLTPVALAPREAPGVRQGDALAHARDAVERALIRAAERDAAGATPRAGSAPLGGRVWRAVAARLRPFAVLAAAPVAAALQTATHAREAAHVFAYVLRQSFVRLAAFYAVVSALLGYTVLYVLTTVGGDFSAAVSIHFVRGMYVIALAPPLTAFLFAAASANAVNAWLGSMRLSGQITALEALGVSRRLYLWGPAWVALALACLAAGAVFATGLLVGGYTMCAQEHVPGCWGVLTSDLVDPVAERAPYRVRALVLIVIYAGGCAANAIARADEPKEKSDDVTRAMTRNVVSTTLWVVALELVSLVIVRATHGSGP